MEHVKKVLALWRMRHDPQAARHFALVFWYALLGVVCAVVLVSIAAGAYLFVGYQGHTAENLVQGGEEVLTRDRIQEVVEAYEQRSLRFNTILERGVTIPSPRR